jgi:hypothetical protein
LSNNSFEENTYPDTIIGYFTAQSLDISDSYTFSLISGDTGSFTIDGNALKTNTTTYNYEIKNSYQIRVRVVDSVNQYFEKNFTISVTNLNETPYGLELSGTIPENSAIGTTVGTITALDLDNGGTYTYEFYYIPGAYDNFSFSLTSLPTITTSV